MAFLPAKLNPQGWLNDFVLPSIYADEAYDMGPSPLQKALYLDNYPGLANKIISLHPEYRNIFIQSMQKVASNSKDKIINQKYVNFMMNLKPYQIAGMQPYIRIYLKTKKGGKKSSWVYSDTKDIIFKPFTDIGALKQKDPAKGILQNMFMRGADAGIESLTVTRDFPAWGMGASFMMDVSYVFSSFQVFAQGHPNESGDPARSHKKDDYLLLLRPDLDNDRQVLVLEYGWRIKNKGDRSFWGVTEDVLNIVEEQERKSFRISWQKHDIEYSEKGEVKLKVKYYGLPERLAFKNPKIRDETDILKPMSMRILKSITKNKNLTEHYKDVEKAKKEIQQLEDDCIKATNKKEQEDKKRKKERKEFLIKRKSVQLEKMKRQFAKKAGVLYLNHIMKKGKLFQLKFRSDRKKVDDSMKFKARRHRLNAYFYRVTELDVPKPSEAIKGPHDIDKKNLIDQWTPKYGVHKSLPLAKLRTKVVKPKTNSKEFIDTQLDKILGALTYSNFGTDKTVTVGSKQPCPAGSEPMEEKATKGKKKCMPKSLSARGERRHGADTYGNFMFFPLRELISTLHEFSKSDEEDDGFNKYPVISLGNVVYRPFGKEISVNIGDILIETDLFLKWFYKTVITREASTITFGQFLSLMMEELVPMALGHGTSDLSSGMVSDIVHTPFAVSVKLAHPSKHANKELDKLYLEKPNKKPDLKIKKDSKGKIIARNLSGDALLLNYQGQAKSSEEKHNDQPVLHFHQRVTDATQISNTGFNSPQLKKTEGRNFNREKDQLDGMFHLFVGNSGGLMETISFSYTDNPNLRTALVFDKFKDIAFPYLKFAYSASPILTGNNLFYKGGYFVLPSTPLGIQPEEDPGITGYYQISRLSDQLAMGTYKTSIQGLNIFSPANQAKRKSQKEILANCGVIPKEKLPKPPPIFLLVGIDEYIVEDFLKNSNYAAQYGLAIMDKEEAAEAHEAGLQLSHSADLTGEQLFGQDARDPNAKYEKKGNKFFINGKPATLKQTKQLTKNWPATPPTAAATSTTEADLATIAGT